MSLLGTTVLAALLGLGSCAVGAVDTNRRTLEGDLARLAGTWRDEQDGRVIEEFWTRFAGGTMLGAGRVLAGGQTVFFEHLRIQARGSSLDYVAMPNGAAGTAFALVQHADGELVFENLLHDFPQRIVYRFQRDGTLYARIEGRREGVLAFEEYRFTRAP